jgi:hypothetical protein
LFRCPYAWYARMDTKEMFSFDTAMLLSFSCRTVALWFYNLLSDHNAIDPVVLKSCNLRRNFFFAHFEDVFLHFPAFLKQISSVP